jgi:hypothetical protein
MLNGNFVASDSTPHRSSRGTTRRMKLFCVFRRLAFQGRKSSMTKSLSTFLWRFPQGGERTLHPGRQRGCSCVCPTLHLSLEDIASRFLVHITTSELTTHTHTPTSRALLIAPQFAELLPPPPLFLHRFWACPGGFAIWPKLYGSYGLEVIGTRHLHLEEIRELLGEIVETYPCFAPEAVLYIVV